MMSAHGVQGIALVLLAGTYMLGGCGDVLRLSGPDDRDGLPIVGLPDPLVTSQGPYAGNLYVADKGLGWADGGAAVVHWVRRYGQAGQPYTLRRIDVQSKVTVSSGLQFLSASGLSSSPDGNAVAFSAPTVGYEEYALYVAAAPPYEPVALDSVSLQTAYVWSADSRLVAYTVGARSVRVREVASGVALPTIQDADLPLAFSPDGGRLLVGRVVSDSLRLEAVGLSDQSRSAMGAIPVESGYWFLGRILAHWDGAGVKVLYEEPAPSQDLVALYAYGTSTVLVEGTGLDHWRLAALSPDGTTAALWYGEWHPTSLLGGFTQDNLYLLDLATGELRLVANAPGEHSGGTVGFAPTGRRLVFSYRSRRVFSNRSVYQIALYVLGY
jgi:hypothetical protein